MARKTYAAYIVLFIAALLVSCTNGRFFPGADRDGDSSTSEITLYFYSEKDLETASGVPSMAVTRMLRISEATPDHALRLLFQGPTQQEQSQGARSFEDLNGLAARYLGIVVKNGIAIVDFDADALQTLNGPAALQAMVKTPIEETLTQFPSITSVEYSIGGRIFTEWDA